MNIEDKSLITVIDVKTMKVLKSWPIAPGEEASGLALDNETHRLFAHHIYLPTAEFNPAPEATADNPRPRRSAKPDSFYVMDIAPIKK